MHGFGQLLLAFFYDSLSSSPEAELRSFTVNHTRLLKMGRASGASIVTHDSTENLGLKPGTEAFELIKSSDDLPLLQVECTSGRL